MMREDEYHDPDIAHNTYLIQVCARLFILSVAVVDYGFLDNCHVTMTLQDSEIDTCQRKN